jgi:formylglycine-generating enzyme required for sulfatase activity
MMIRRVCTVWVLSLLIGLGASGAATAGLLPKDGEAQYELEFWESIKNSTHAEDYEAYLEAYPNGRFAPLAKARAARYAKSAPEAVEQSAPPIEDMDIQYQAVTNANVRGQPSSRAERVGQLSAGERVHVSGRIKDRNWYRVELSDGTTGFVYGELLREAVTAPKAAAPATHTAAPKAAPATPKAPSAAPASRPAATPAPTAATGASDMSRDCEDCPEMVVVQPGSFIMGDDHGDRSERPAHRVTISRPFAIGKYEVTVAQWKACVKAGACRAVAEETAQGMSDNSPARDLSWNDARKYVQWLSKVTGKKYRLPTEAEWEYAARAGTSTRYWWGDKMESGKANCKGCGGSWSKDAPAKVDDFPPNPYGIYGMNGGVWEWAADCWHRSYAGRPPTDGSAWTEPDCRENVIRGGSWRNDSTYAHSASRFTYDTAVRYILNGFRVAKSLQ